MDNPEILETLVTQVVHSLFRLRFSLTFIYYLRYVLCLVYPMLPVFLDCPFLIAPSVFSNVYLPPIVCPVSCVLCDQCFQYFWIVHSRLLPRFSLTFIYYLVYVLYFVWPMFPVSLDCPFLITPSVFSNVYLLLTLCPVSCVPNVASFSGFSIYIKRMK
jgi:hypothetical protein